MREHYAYQNRANRDAMYRELVKHYGKDNVWRHSLRGQQMHPMYVADFEGPEKFDTGCNTVYQTYFPVIYIVEVR